MKDFSLSDYECIGFDLDMTLARYKLRNFNELIYNALSNYLINEKGYIEKFLIQSIDINFPIRGLIADNENGNLIRISSDGTIVQATHGTKWLSKEEILKFYPTRHWKHTDALVRDPPVTSHQSFRLLGDFLNMPISLVFARAIDSVDEVQGEQKNYKVLPDIAAGMKSIIFKRGLCENNLGVFSQLKKDPDLIYHKCSEQVLEWLRDLKRSNKKLFLMTGADVSHAYLTAESTLGENWRDFFDIIICYSEKPDFFTKGEDFIGLDGFKETGPVPSAHLKVGKTYTHGNWRGLRKFLVNLCGRDNPKMLYIGDNLIQDVCAPNLYSQVDTVAICEELEAEKEGDGHPDAAYIRSTLWGSFFPSEDIEDTFWYGLIRTYAKICVPSIEYLAEFPINHKFNKNYA